MRIGHGSARNQATEQNPGGFVFARISQQGDVHLFCPGWNRRAVGSIGNGTGVLQRQWLIVQPMPGNQGSVSHSAPAARRVLEKLPIDEIGHRALSYAIEDLRNHVRSEEQQISAGGIQLQNAVQR